MKIFSDRINGFYRIKKQEAYSVNPVNPVNPVLKFSEQRKEER